MRKETEAIVAAALAVVRSSSSREFVIQGRDHRFLISTSRSVSRAYQLTEEFLQL